MSWKFQVSSVYVYRPNDGKYVVETCSQKRERQTLQKCERRNEEDGVISDGIKNENKLEVLGRNNSPTFLT
jgi:hypothetical protein